MKILTLIFLFTVASGSINAAELLFKPPVGSVIEARIGSFYQTDEERLRLDIGYSMDMKNLLKNEKYTINLGADFFTYTRLRSEGRMKFPVETTDFFFGVNISGSGNDSTDSWDWRLRLAHISSHLSDGYSDSGSFRFEPYVYSREFVDLIISYNYLFPGNIKIRPYAGLTYIFSTIPDDVVLFIPQAGLEVSGPVSENLAIVAGADIKTGGTSANVRMISNVQAGVKIKGIEGTSLLLSIYKYDGPSLHGLFFRENDSYFGIGFQLLFY